MAGVDGLIESVSYHLAVADTTEESTLDDATANFTVLDEPMDTEEATDSSTLGLANFTSNEENNGPHRGGQHLRSGDCQGIFLLRLPSN